MFFETTKKKTKRGDAHPPRGANAQLRTNGKPPSPRPPWSKTRSSAVPRYCSSHFCLNGETVFRATEKKRRSGLEKRAKTGSSRRMNFKKKEPAWALFSTGKRPGGMRGAPAFLFLKTSFFRQQPILCPIEHAKKRGNLCFTAWFFVFLR